MKRTITVISECNSDNLGDKAIARFLFTLLLPFYDVSLVSFSKIPVNHLDKSIVSAKSHNSSLRKIINIIPVIVKARIKWYFLGDKELFKEHFRKSIDGSDLVVVGGGQLIKNNIALFCEKLSILGEVSRMQSTSTALIGVGVDKKMSTLTWYIVRRMLQECRFIVVRDLTSRQRILNSIKLKKDCLSLPDLAFALSNPGLDRFDSIRDISLAINVMNLDTMLSQFNNGKKFAKSTVFEGFCSIVRHAHENGSTLVLFTSGDSGDFCTADSIRSDILARTGVDLPIFHPSTLDELLEFLLRVNHVIATRMHAGILAYISGCNPLCINWDDKVKGVWSAIHQQERVIEIEKIASEEAGTKILKRLNSLSPPSRHSLENLADDVRTGVLRQIEKALMGGENLATCNS